MIRLLASALLASCLAATPAVAMERDGPRMNMGNRAAVTDPDARLEALAAAGTVDDTSHAKPKKSARNVLKDDPYLKDAFGWLDNK